MRADRDDDLLTPGELRQVKRFRKLRERQQLPLDLLIMPPYDARRHPFIVTDISRKDGGGWENVENCEILVYLDITEGER
jgi:hypothetical protein